MEAGEEERRGHGAMGGRGWERKEAGKEVQGGLTSPRDAASTGLRTHEHVSISFKVRRKKIHFVLRRKCYNT